MVNSIWFVSTAKKIYLQKPVFFFNQRKQYICCGYNTTVEMYFFIS